MRRAVPPRREQTGDVATDRAQSQLSETGRAVNSVVEDLRGCPFFPGVLVSVSLESLNAKTITHNLGAAAAFLIARGNYGPSFTPAVVTEASSSDLDPRRQIRVIADIACIVDLWFYRRASARVPL
jgi:hypothetical protein